MTKSTGVIKVDGLDCSTEESRIRNELESWPGLISMQFDLDLGQLSVTFDDAQTNLESLTNAISNNCGYGCRVLDRPDEKNRNGDSGPKKWLIWPGRRAGLILGAGLLEVIGLIFWYSGSHSIGYGLFGVSIFLSANWIIPRVSDSLSRHRLDIYVLVGLAVAGASLLGLWDEAATVGVLFGVSELLEAYATRRARVSIESLMELQPDQAEFMTESGEIRVVDPATLLVGDRVRVRPGQKLPIDATVVQGMSHVDQKIITGESIPVAVAPGNEVFAGTLNGEGVLVLETLRPFELAVVNCIARKVEEARGLRAPIQRLVDRFASRYTPIIVFLAGSIIIVPPLFHMIQNEPSQWQEWLLRGLVLLVIACPCALVISTPVAIVSAVANAARHGVLVRDGGVIEHFGQLKLIAFDKTGTLTVGRPAVVEVQTVQINGSHDEMLVKAAAVGLSGSHVVSRAIVRHAHEKSLDIPNAEDVREVPGLGSTGVVAAERIHLGSHRYLDQEGLCDPDFHSRMGTAELSAGTAVAVSGGQGPLGWIRLADEPRAEATDALKKINQLGVRTMMLTGDNAETARAMAQSLGIDEFRAHLMPDEKAQIINHLVRNVGSVGMVGDGVNDAPALTEANIGISMGSIASAVTSQTADIVLINNNLLSLGRLIQLSRTTVSTIKFNVTLALGSKLIVVIMAAFGEASFALAMLADVGISLIVVTNSLRLLRFEPK